MDTAIRRLSKLAILLFLFAFCALMLRYASGKYDPFLRTCLITSPTDPMKELHIDVPSAETSPHMIITQGIQLTVNLTPDWQAAYGDTDKKDIILQNEYGKGSMRCLVRSVIYPEQTNHVPTKADVDQARRAMTVRRSEIVSDDPMMDPKSELVELGGEQGFTLSYVKQVDTGKSYNPFVYKEWHLYGKGNELILAFSAPLLPGAKIREIHHQFDEIANTLIIAAPSVPTGEHP